MTTTGRGREPSGTTREVESHLRGLAVLHQRLSETLEASADLLREIRLKMEALQKAMGKRTLEELSRGETEVLLGKKTARAKQAAKP